MENIIISDEAYKHDGGAPILLLAGPGTGKTYQLAKRIQYLTSEKSVNADEITVITFTTEAARGMREKLEKHGGNEYIDPTQRPKNIFTMHALGHKILSDNFELIGLKEDFIVVEDNKIRKPLMRDAAILLKYTEKDGDQALKDRTYATSKPSEESKKIIKKYEEILRVCNSIDHDDQISLACKLLKENEPLRKKYSKNSKYLLVDEYQDINQGQFELIDLLSRDHKEGLFVVGDDDQSIYSFRGGSPTFIRNFRKHFGANSIIIQMQTSRRCPTNVLECASCIVAQFDSARVPKGNYKYSKDNLGKVVLHDCPSDDREAEIIATIIKSTLDEETRNDSEPKKHFILVPNKNYVSKIQDILKKWRITFNSNFEDKDKGLSNFVLIKGWVSNNDSNFLTRQCIELMIESGTVGIPSSRSRTEENIKNRIKGLTEIVSLWDVVISSQKTLFSVLKEKSEFSDVLKNILDKFEELLIVYERDNVPDFLSKVANYTKPWSSLVKFFQEIYHLSKSQIQTTSAGVTNVRVLTMNSSKGLQETHIYIIGLEEEIIPRKDSIGDVLSEEARLLFVGMTRAQEELHLFKSRKRTSSSTYRPIPHDLKVSRFLNYLPTDKYEKQFHPVQSKIKKAKIELKK